MRVAVVILNWNTEGFLRSFLPDVRASLPEWAEAVVVDNGSTDGSPELLSTGFPGLRTILFEDNYGFTGGYNRAMSRLMGDCPDMEYAVLMNSDVKVAPGWLEPLVEWMDAHRGCGACGPKLHALDRRPHGGYLTTGRFEYAGAAGGYLDRFGYPWCRGRVLDRTEEDTGQYDRPKDVLWVSGACMLVRTAAWRKLGGFDDRFFAHMEEIDLCWRMQNAGMKVTVVPQSTVWHLGGGSLPEGSPWKLRQNYRNNLLMLENNLAPTLAARGEGRGSAATRIAVRKLLDRVSALVYRLSGRKEDAAAAKQARSEYRSLSKGLADGIGRGPVPGYTGLCIIPLYYILGKRIFKYLRKYEDNH